MRFKPRILQGKLGIRQLYSEISREYDFSEKLFITRLMELSEEPVITGFLENFKAKYSLDAGAGTGRYLKKLREISDLTIALDISDKMIYIAKNKYAKISEKIEYVVADMEYLPFRKLAFDMILSTLTINHLEEVDTFLKEAWRTLKVKGVLIFSTLNKIVLEAYSKKYGIPKDMVLFQTEHITPTYVYEKGSLFNEIVCKLRIVGFKILKSKAVGYWMILGLLPKSLEISSKILMRMRRRNELVKHLDRFFSLLVPSKYAFIHVFKVFKWK